MKMYVTVSSMSHNLVPAVGYKLGNKGTKEGVQMIVQMFLFGIG